MRNCPFCDSLNLEIKEITTEVSKLQEHDLFTGASR